MKRYLQACEVGGFIYGKKRQALQKSPAEKKYSSSCNMVSSYNDFYKNQVMALRRVISNDKG